MPQGIDFNPQPTPNAFDAFLDRGVQGANFGFGLQQRAMEQQRMQQLQQQQMFENQMATEEAARKQKEQELKQAQNTATFALDFIQKPAFQVLAKQDQQKIVGQLAPALQKAYGIDLSGVDMSSMDFSATDFKRAAKRVQEVLRSELSDEEKRSSVNNILLEEGENLSASQINLLQDTAGMKDRGQYIFRKGPGGETLVIDKASSEVVSTIRGEAPPNQEPITNMTQMFDPQFVSPAERDFYQGELTKFQNRVNQNSLIRSSKDLLDKTARLWNYLDAENPAASTIVQSLIIRQLGGEVGVLTDSDVRRAGGNPALAAKAKRLGSLASRGLLPESDIEDFKELVRIAETLATQRMDRELGQLVRQTSSRLPRLSESVIRQSSGLDTSPLPGMADEKSAASRFSNMSTEQLLERQRQLQNSQSGGQ